MWLGVILIVMTSGQLASGVSRFETEAECEAGIARMATIANASVSVRSYGVACVQDAALTKKKIPPSNEPPPAKADS